MIVRILGLALSCIATFDYAVLFRRKFLAMPHEPERFLFAVFRELLEQEQQLLVSRFRHFLVRSTLGQVQKRRFLRISFLVVRLGGGHAVAEHLLDVTVGHVHRHDFLCLHVVIVPELKVVLVAALVVHPCEAHARVAALAVVRRFFARVVFCARDKFAGTVLRQIVEQSLQPDTGLKAKPDDLVSMLCNRDEMPNRMEHARKLAKAENLGKFVEIFFLFTYLLQTEPCQNRGVFYISSCGSK